MLRIQTANRLRDAFGAGKDGFRSAVPGVSDPTYLEAAWFNAVQEAIVRTAEAAGLTPTDDHNQFIDALNRLFSPKTLGPQLAERGDPALGSNLVGHAGGSLRDTLLTIASQISAVQAGQGAGVVGYSDYPSLMADLTRPDKTIGYVTNDPIIANNGVYRKSGAEGVGTWIKTAASLESVEIASRVDEIRRELSDVRYICGYSSVPPIRAGDMVAVVGPFVFADAVISTGALSSISLFAAVGGILKVQAWSKNGDFFTLLRESSVTVEQGYQILPVSMVMSKGEHLGFYGPGIVTYTSALSDGMGWYAGSGNSFTDATVETSIRLHIRFDGQVMLTSEALESSLASRASQARVSALENSLLTMTRSHTIGQAGVIPAGDAALNGAVMWALEEFVPHHGTLTSFSCYTAKAGDVRVMTYSKNGDVFTVEREVTLAATGGYESFHIELPVDVGHYVGFQSDVVQQQSTETVPSGWYGAAGYQSFTDSTVSRSGRLLVGFQLDYRTAQHATARPTVADLPWENMLIIGTGQSLMEGSQTATSGTVPITTVQEYDTLGFPAHPAAPSALSGATVATTEHQVGRGEWPGLGCAAAIRAALLRDNNLGYGDIKSTVVIANNAVGGSPISTLVRGTPPYASGIAQAAALAALTGQTAGVLAVIYGQGESDAATDPAIYRSTLIQLAADYDADLRAATGQTRRVQMVCYQVGTESRGIALAQLEAALTSDLISMLGPMYQFTYYDALHIDSVSSRRLGAYYGEAVKMLAIDNRAWEPLRPVSAQVIGNTITVTFNKAGLAFDTIMVPAQPDHGFSVQMATMGAAPIVGIEIRNSNQVRITCASPPAADWVVQYGVAAVGLAPYYGRAGNLRDSTGDVRKFDQWPLHNWCVCFDWKL